jgi:A/G-specific adenine glycosylase
MGGLNKSMTAEPDYFSMQLLSWYERNGRKQLPWQHNRTAYRVWLSEIMLQQTQVATVIPYFERFIARFPGVHDLAKATHDEVMKYWSGLGYYARARNLHACAKQVSLDYDGVFPETVEQLQQLPGIGRSTAGAIVAQACNKRAVILDGNVKRVLTRYRMVPGWTGQAAVQKRLWRLAEELTPEQRPADYTQAIMDLGSMVCRRANPLCGECPVSVDCEAYKQGMTGQYPQRKVRAQIPEKEAYMLLCYPSDIPCRILLEKRPPTGIWGGLWSLPQCEPAQEPLEFIEAQYGYQAEKIEEAGAIMHRFTHFQLCIRPLRIQVTTTDTQIRNSSIHWCDQDNISEYGMPKPVNRLVADFFERHN